MGNNKSLTRVSPISPQTYTPPQQSELSHELTQLTQQYGWVSSILASTIRCWSLDIVGLVSSYAAGLRPLLVPAHMPMPIPFPQRIVQTFCDFESGDVAIVCRSNERLERLMFEPKRLASNYAYIGRRQQAQQQQKKDESASYNWSRFNYTDFPGYACQFLRGYLVVCDVDMKQHGADEARNCTTFFEIASQWRIPRVLQKICIALVFWLVIVVSTRW